MLIAGPVGASIAASICRPDFILQAAAHGLKHLGGGDENSFFSKASKFMSEMSEYAKPEKLIKEVLKRVGVGEKFRNLVSGAVKIASNIINPTADSPTEMLDGLSSMVQNKYVDYANRVVKSTANLMSAPSLDNMVDTVGKINSLTVGNEVIASSVQSYHKAISTINMLEQFSQQEIVSFTESGALDSYLDDTLVKGKQETKQMIQNGCEVNSLVLAHSIFS